MVREECLPLVLVVVDSKEATIGISDGERVEVVWSGESFVMGKHRRGGQSKERFARGREQALKQWYRKVVDVLIDVRGERKIVVGGPSFTKDDFVKHIPGWLSDEVSDVRCVGYTDENGLYELLGRSRYGR